MLTLHKLFLLRNLIANQDNFISFGIPVDFKMVSKRKSLSLVTKITFCALVLTAKDQHSYCS